MTRLATTIPDNPPALLDGIPIVYEDDLLEELGMGEGSYHYEAGGILYWAIKIHLRQYHPDVRVYANLNCYYLDAPLSPKSGRAPYVCPDVMVIRPATPNLDPINSYRMDRDGTAPLLAVEVLSHISGKIRDPEQKPEIYARLGIQEYILLDELGKFLPQPLLLKRLREDRTWEDVVDDDGGVTSQLGFRLIHDGQVHVVDMHNERVYPHPDQAVTENQALREELERLKSKKKTRRRKKGTNSDEA